MHVSSLKAPIDEINDAPYLKELKLAAVRARREMVQMGYDSHIRLHYGALMGMIDIVVLLYFHWLNVHPEEPGWTGRDRFVLSKGHGAPSLYSVLSERGFFSKEHLRGFRRLGSILQGHPDRLKTPGIEATTGSLGQGLAIACGMALAGRMDRAQWRTYCLIGDGECNEGSIWEAALVAGNLHLDSLVVVMDRNKKSSYGPMAGRNDIEPVADKWRDFGWEVFEADGHDFADMSRALARAETVEGHPALVICHTVKGKGIPFVENYPTKANILLTDEQYSECISVLEATEREIVNG